MIKKILTLAMLSASAFAQDGGYSRDGSSNISYQADRYRNPSSYGRSFGPSNPYGSRQRFIDSLQADLQRIENRSAWSGWSKRQFFEAIDNLERYQYYAVRGRFDNNRLDRAIDNLNRLLTSREINPADLQRIAVHRDQLRRFRSNGGLS